MSAHTHHQRPFQSSGILHRHGTCVGAVDHCSEMATAGVRMATAGVRMATAGVSGVYLRSQPTKRTTCFEIKTCVFYSTAALSWAKTIYL